MILLTTIRQSGTNYMMNEIGRDAVKQIHCTPPVLDMLDDYDRVITTYRSPYQVARSWAQRYTWKEVENVWREQWGAWRKVVDWGAEVARVDEFTGEKVKRTPPGDIYHELTRAIHHADWDAYYKHVPKELIDYAVELVPAGYE